MDSTRGRRHQGIQLRCGANSERLLPWTVNTHCRGPEGPSGNVSLLPGQLSRGLTAGLESPSMSCIRDSSVMYLHLTLHRPLVRFGLLSCMREAEHEDKGGARTEKGIITMDQTHNQ